MKKLTIRKLIMGLALCGITFDLAFDFISYQHIKSSDKAGHEVVQSYEILLQLQKIDRALVQLFVPPIREGELQEAKNQISYLGDLIENRVEQRKLYNQVVELLQPLSVADPSKRIIIEESAEKASDLVAQMLALESHSLQPQLQEDISENHKIEHSSTMALILDAFLGIMVLGLFLLDHRLRKKMEENLAESLQDILEVNQTLEEERLKRQMSLRTIVHDLKSPLGSIQGFAELLSEEKSESSVQEFSERIKRISQKSLALVESLLTPLPEDEKNFTTVDLVKVLKELGSHFEGVAQLKDQDLKWDLKVSHAMVQGVEVRLEELFSNLISNAVKYSPRGKTIWIRCNQAGGKIRVEIEDQGPGFDAEDLPKAFRYGQTLKAKPTGGETSTGLGLFIVKQIIEKHDGAIAIRKGAQGKGACFVVEFPVPTLIASSSTEGAVGTRSRRQFMP